MATTRAIVRVLEAISENWQGKFSINPPVESGDPMQCRVGTVKRWEIILSDIDDELVLAATADLVSRDNPWPPTTGQIRTRAIELRDGEITRMSGDTAWGEVQDWISSHGHADGHRPSDHLPKSICDAVEAAGGWHTIRYGSLTGSTRSAFVRAYDAARTKRIDDAVTLPQVRQLVDRRLPALPSGQDVSRMIGGESEEQKKKTMSVLRDARLLNEE